MKKSILSQEQATIKYPWLEHLCHACQINMTHISFSEDEIGPQLLNLVIDKNFKRKDRLYVLTDKKGNELGYVGYDQEEISLFSPIANLCSLFDVPHYGDDLEMETVKNAIIRNDHSLEKITYVVEVIKIKRGFWVKTEGASITVYSLSENSTWAFVMHLT